MGFRSFVAVVFASLLVFSGSAVAATEAAQQKPPAPAADTIEQQLPDLSHLKAYVGAYPLKDFVKEKGKYQNLKEAFRNFKSIWDDPAFRKTMYLTFGKEVTNQIINVWGKNGLEQTPVQQDGNLLYAFAGKPTLTEDNRVFVYINLGNGPGDKAANTIQACWHWKAPNGTIYDYWLATGQKDRRLQPNACSWKKGGKLLLANYGRGTLAKW